MNLRSHTCFCLSQGNIIKIIKVPHTAIKTISPVTIASPLNPLPLHHHHSVCVLLCSCDGWCLRWKPHCCCVCCCPWNTWAHCVSPWAFCHAWPHTLPTTRWTWATWLLCWRPTSCTSTGTQWTSLVVLYWNPDAGTEPDALDFGCRMLSYLKQQQHSIGIMGTPQAASFCFAVNNLRHMFALCMYPLILLALTTFLPWLLLPPVP